MAASQPGAEPAPVGQETVLVAESDAAVRHLVERVLTRLGYDVLSAADGPSALTQATAHADRLALLITELALPVLSGPEIVARVRHVCPRAKVLFVSAGASPVATAPAPLLQKPFTTLGLARRVRAALDAPAPFVH